MRDSEKYLGTLKTVEAVSRYKYRNFDKYLAD
jgi:hypothetical protein